MKLNAFRNQSLERAGEYFVLDGRLHGPHEKLPLVVNEQMTASVVLQKTSVDIAAMVTFGLVLPFTTTFTVVCWKALVLGGGSPGSAGLIAVLLVFALLTTVVVLAILQHLYECFWKRHGATLLVRSPNEPETQLWFKEQEEAARVRDLIERTS